MQMTKNCLNQNFRNDKNNYCLTFKNDLPVFEKLFINSVNLVDTELVAAVQTTQVFLE